MKTITYAEVALLNGPFTNSETVEVPARGEEGLKFLKEKFGDAIVAFVYFDILETEIRGLGFTSDPHNQEKVIVMEKDVFERRVHAERGKLSNVLDVLIADLLGGSRENKPNTLH